MEDMSHACFQPNATFHFLFNDTTHIAEET